MIKNFFSNLIDILCLSSCGIFVCIVTKTIPVPQEGFSLPQEHLAGIAVALLLMLLFRRLTKMVWNIVYCIATIVLVAALLQWATKGVLMPPVLQEMAAPYSIPALLEGGCYYELGSFALLWLMGALCCHGFWRVTITAVGSYAVWLILSLALHIAAKAWLNMEDAPLADLQPVVRDFPWVTAAFPGCLILCYAVLMSIFDALFMGWADKKDTKETKEGAKEGKKPEPPAVSTTAAPAAVTKTSSTKPLAKPVAKAKAPTRVPAKTTPPASETAPKENVGEPDSPAPAAKENAGEAPASDTDNKPGDTSEPKE